MSPGNHVAKDICLVATDVEALFPSLEAGETGRICKQMIRDGELKLEGINWQEALLYLHLNQGYLDREDLAELEPYLPVRKRKGKEPQMTGPRVRGAKKVGELSEKEEQWTHRPPPSNESLRRLIMGMMVQIGVQAAFTCYCYTFGGEIFQQKKGGANW